jgi:hypothetical protein
MGLQDAETREGMKDIGNRVSIRPAPETRERTEEVGDKSSVRLAQQPLEQRKETPKEPCRSS